MIDYEIRHRTVMPDEPIGLACGLSHGIAHPGPHYGVDPRTFANPETSPQTLLEAVSVADVIVGRLLIHDQSGVILWVGVEPHARRQGIAWQLYGRALTLRGSRGLRNGILRHGSSAIWKHLKATVGVSVTVEADGGYVAFRESTVDLIQDKTCPNDRTNLQISNYKNSSQGRCNECGYRVTMMSKEQS